MNIGKNSHRHNKALPTLFSKAHIDKSLEKLVKNNTPGNNARCDLKERLKGASASELGLNLETLEVEESPHWPKLEVPIVPNRLQKPMACHLLMVPVSRQEVGFCDPFCFCGVVTRQLEIYQ